MVILQYYCDTLLDSICYYLITSADILKNKITLLRFIWVKFRVFFCDTSQWRLNNLNRSSEALIGNQQDRGWKDPVFTPGQLSHWLISESWDKLLTVQLICSFSYLSLQHVYYFIMYSLIGKTICYSRVNCHSFGAEKIEEGIQCKILFYFTWFQ